MVAWADGQEVGWNKGRSEEEMKKEKYATRVPNSFTHSSRNITNPEVVFASLCAMIPGGIV